MQRRYITIDSLKENMIIDQSIIDISGRLLISRKTSLTATMLRTLKDMCLPGVYICDHTEPEPPMEAVLTRDAEIAARIEKERIPDRSVAAFNAAVKKQVAEGIQYLYGNTEAENFMDIANAIADSLLHSIQNNRALAFDINLLKVCDEYTFNHSVDVAAIGIMLAQKSNFTPQEIHEIGVCGLLHDIGKSKIPSNILNKPGKLSREECNLMKRHPIFGYEIIKNKTNLSIDILNGVLQHHEKTNGKGYPQGLMDSQIGRFAKILAIADIYDALVTKRPYKAAFSQRDATEMIMAMSGELDIPTLRIFLSTVILYPVGSIVALSNGEQAEILANHSGFPLRPKVIGLRTGCVYDLAEDLACANLIID